jgi:hypothetical protein
MLAMTFTRKDFVSAAALGITGVALLSDDAPAAAAQAEKSALHFHVLRPAEYDHAAFMKKLAVQKHNKQVFFSVSPILIAGAASIYLHMQNSMNAYEFSYVQGPGSLATLGVLTGPSIVLSLNDAMWSKYAIGSALNLAPSNVYYTASSLTTNGAPDDPDTVYQDWSAQAVMHRGGTFVVCHNAMTAVAGLFAQKSGAQPQAVLAEFKHNMLPGFQLVPAGVAAVQLAAEHGWMPYPII